MLTSYLSILCQKNVKKSMVRDEITAIGEILLTNVLKENKMKKRTIIIFG